MNFRELENIYGVAYEPEKYPSSLSDWYISVRDVPLESLGVGDVCRAVRQDVFISDLLGAVICLLEEDVLAGDLYDGELLAALSQLQDDFWRAHILELGKIVEMLKGGAADGVSDQRLLSEVSSLLECYGRLKVGG
ncbi:contact-dependent growth inhibition system immunity protein [Pseudomonas wadenswilerensis]